MTPRPAVAVALTALALAAGYLWLAPSAEERAIRGRLEDLAATFNAGSTDGLGALTHAARLGGFFTEDIVVELGRASMPIEGRETLMGMAARLQPRTAEFSVAFQDVTIEVLGEAHADVSLTAVIRHSTATPRETIDAREFAVQLRKVGRLWHVSRAAAIDTLR